MRTALVLSMGLVLVAACSQETETEKAEVTEDLSEPCAA